MDDRVKNTSIQEIFHKMDYGESYEKVDEAIEWIKNKESSFFANIEKSTESVNGTKVELKNRINEEMLCAQYVPEAETVKKILSKSNGKVKWIDISAFQRTTLLNKLAAEIEKSAGVLSQLEIVCRGILGRDTRSNAILLLAQYFYYYSNFAMKYGHENPNWKPEGVAVGVISNENVLSNLGLILAPALASGYNVVLQVGTALFPTVAFIIELAKKVGIPEQVIRLIPSDDGDLQPYLSSENVSLLALLVDLNNEKYVGSNILNKKILNLSSNKIPVIIFDNADLDSACTSIIDAAWGYQGLLPWSVNTIIVQENVVDKFLSKLKTEIHATKVGLGNNKLVDISSTGESSFNKLDKLIKSAKDQGIEVFQATENLKSFTPTLFVGGKVSTNRVLSADEDQDANVVTVIAFRSIDEAVNLANNSRQGLAASVWTENVGIVNEVAKKLRVNNVWINSHGLTAPEIALCPVKDSGTGYFGGKEGFYEYVQVKKTTDSPTTSNAPTKISSSQASFVSFAKKSQENWSRLSKLNKSKIFQKFAEYVESNKKELGASMTSVFLDEWIAEIFQCVTETNNSNTTTQADYNVVSAREPRGVIAIENEVEYELKNIRLILTALFEGNAVILLTNSTNSLTLYNELSTRLPTAVFTVLSYNLNNIQIISAHKELGAYFGEGVNAVYSALPLRDSKIYTNVSNNWNDVYRKVTFSKNVWSNIGKSSTCNLSTY
ncbi:aldehyde dehydrogenase family 8 member A1 [Anoplophora glabripennis]|uniref:aldehyde dehydrogenase family 8 member A1 n=1 Tax=Anoplophora glabripennis TaxID=217634 RepID=UPI0008739422|nr:aldehyde dehydrogenase family 8 member A1 [Anoplophora glabripennis]